MVALAYSPIDTNSGRTIPVERSEISDLYRSWAISSGTDPFGIPLQILQSGQFAPNWEIVRQFLITIERDEDGRFLANDEITVVYGDGDTPFDALQDYFVSLIDYYQLISARAEQDHPTRALFVRLQKYIQHYNS